MTIVNFSTYQYLIGQNRLANSIKGYPVLLYRDYRAINSPTHQQSPYEFKVYAIEKAFENDDIILWCDSSFYCVGDLSLIENIIKEQGYFFTESGHYVGRWCNSHTRQYFQLTADELKQEPGGMTMFNAGLMGLNKNSPLTMEFFRLWKKSGRQGCFRGSWDDHRHDMTAGSIIAQRLNMKYLRIEKYLAYIGPGYGPPANGVVFMLQGI